MPKVKLKSCPFCSSKNIEVSGFLIGYRYQAGCNDCKARGPIVRLEYTDDVDARGEKEALKAWNKRVEAKP